MYRVIHKDFSHYFSNLMTVALDSNDEALVSLLLAIGMYGLEMGSFEYDTVYSMPFSICEYVEESKK